MIQPPLFVIFMNSGLSINLLNLILNGKIHAYIYTPQTLSLQLKKHLSKNKTNNNNVFYQINVCNMPYNFTTFNFLLTSKSFWDNIPTKYLNVFVMFNPKLLQVKMQIKSKYDKPFYLIPLKECKLLELIYKNPTLVDEQLVNGFLFYVNNKFARKTIRTFTKKKILEVRKEHKMLNNEAIERQSITPFYHYFIHNALNLGYNF
jgi:hypothetical protein